MFNKLRALGRFQGRANRAVYWAVAIVMVVTSRLVEWRALALEQTDSDADLVITCVGLLVVLVLVWLFLATAVRRLHDTGKSGKWALLFIGVPILARAVLPSGEGDSISRLAIPLVFLALGTWVIVFGIVLWALRVLGVSKGTAGPNQYGPDPLAPAADAAPAAG